MLWSCLSLSLCLFCSKERQEVNSSVQKNGHCRSTGQRSQCLWSTSLENALVMCLSCFLRSVRRLMSAFRRMGTAEAQVSSHNAWGQPVLKMLWSCVSLVCKERQEFDISAQKYGHCRRTGQQSQCLWSALLNMLWSLFLALFL